MNKADENPDPSSSSSTRSSESSRSRRASSTSSAPSSRGNFLSNEPRLNRYHLSPERRYVLVIESDGISDYMDDQTLMQYVTKLSSRGKGAGKIAQEVASSTADRRGSDNGSCIVVLLDGQNS